MTVAVLIFAVVVALNQQTTTQAAPQAVRPIPRSLLPEPVGIAIRTRDAVRIAFDEPMDAGSVAAALRLSPANPTKLSWNEDRTELSIAPERRWRTDRSYIIAVGATATTAAGEQLAGARRYTFSTETAPTVTDFGVRVAETQLAQHGFADLELTPMRAELSVQDERNLAPDETAREVSASSPIRVSFSDPMSRSDVEERFTISPEVPGELSWVGHDLVFTPGQPLEPGGRYTISLLGARDRVGNELSGDANFTFVVRDGAQLVRTTPMLDAHDVEPATVEMWFSQPMDVDATNAAFGLTDTSTGRLVPGRLNWNETATQMVYVPNAQLAGGRTFVVSLGAGAADAEGNPLTAEWSFATAPRAEAPAPAPPVRAAATGAAPAPVFAPPPAVGASGLEEYGLAQINSARAAYGLPPLVLDWAMSAVAAGHAWDQLNRNYYSHTTLGTGASVRDRLAAAGIGFSAAGENQCHAMMGLGAQGTMNWCHGVFMAEPRYDAAGNLLWNHINNILSSRYTRVGIGVADNGSRVVITWDFAN